MCRAVDGLSCAGLDWVGLEWFGLDCVCLRLVGAREIIVGLKRARMREEKTGLARHCWAQARADEGGEDGLSPAEALNF